MFAQLLASQPIRQRATAGVATSVTFHGFLVAAAVYATVGTPPMIESPAATHVVYVPVEPAPAPAPPPAQVNPIIAGPPTVSVPFTVPLTLPSVLPTLPTTGVELAPGTRFIVGAPTVPVTPSATPGSAYLAAQVEVEVALEKNSPVPRFPSALRAAGIEGDARFRFVVDTLGRVELATIERLSATREAFAMAVREALPRMRFRAAQVSGRPVRQLVELPFDFRVRR